MTNCRNKHTGSRTISNDAIFFKSGRLSSFRDETSFITNQYPAKGTIYDPNNSSRKNQDSSKKKHGSLSCLMY